MNNLIKTRKFLKLSQKDMANLINVSRNTYSDYERKIADMPLKKLNIIANKYHLSLDYLLDLTDNYNNLVSSKNIVENEIGITLKNLREQALLSQYELAEKLDTYQSRISDFEKGRGLTIIVLKKYALLFNKSVDYICGKA